MQNLLKLSQLFGVSMEFWIEDESKDGGEDKGAGDGAAIRENQKTENVQTKPYGKKKKKNVWAVAIGVAVIGACCAMPLAVLYLVLQMAAVSNQEYRVTTESEILALEEVYNIKAVPENLEENTMDGYNPSDGTEDVDYLNSPESTALQEAVFNFARAYFSGDKQEAEKYTVIESANLEVWESDVWEELDALNLKWNPEDAASADVIHVQYEFRMKGEDSNTYLGLDVLLIQGEWKITDIYLEK